MHRKAERFTLILLVCVLYIIAGVNRFDGNIFC